MTATETRDMRVLLMRLLHRLLKPPSGGKRDCCAENAAETAERTSAEDCSDCYGETSFLFLRSSYLYC